MLVKNKETGAIHEIAPGSRAERRVKSDPKYEEVKHESKKPAEKSG